MKRIVTAVMALVLLNSTSSMAQSYDQNRDGQGQYNDRYERDRYERDRNERERNERERNGENRDYQNRYGAEGNQDRRYNYGSRQATPRWSRGDRLPNRYRQNQYILSDWRGHNLRRPPRGHHWIVDNDSNYYLVVIGSGLILEAIYRADSKQRWRERYRRNYTYRDDVYYRECRNSPDPAGIMVGALIGGLLGNTAGRGDGRAGATIAGVVLGGALGAALTNDLDCEDRSYAYRTYYDGFNSGRPHSRYRWHNPRNDHRGEFRVGNYYNDPYGFRCAEFTQIAYIGGRPEEVHGNACRQPDGAWAIVN